MGQVMVRYEVRPDRVEENVELVRAVYAELAATRPPGLRYVTFLLDDGVTSVHVAATDTDDGSPLGQVAAFARFQHELADRVVAAPVATALHRVGSYGVFDE
jgi:hypothetical protein